MRRIELLIVAALFIALGGFDTQAKASILGLLVNGANSASDEDSEYLIDNTLGAIVPHPGPDGITGTLDDTTAVAPIGQIDVGDSFRGHINFNTLNSVGANLGGLTGNPELSGEFQALVLSKVFLAPGIVSYTFGPDPTFAPVGGVNVPGAIIQLWEDASPNYAANYTDPTLPAGLVHDDGALHPPHLPPNSADVSVGPYADEELFIDTATDGLLFATFGFSMQPGEGFSGLSTAGDNVLTLFGISSGSSGGLNNFAVSRLDGGAPGFGDEIFDPITLGPTVSPFGNPLFLGIVGSQQIRGVNDRDTPFEVTTNTNIAFNVQSVVPEPASLFVWFGLIAGSVAATIGGRKRG